MISLVIHDCLDLCLLCKSALKVTCPATNSAWPGPLDGTFLEPCQKSFLNMYIYMIFLTTCNIKNTQGFVFALRKTEGNPVLGSFMHTVHCMISSVPSIQCMNFTCQYLYDKTTNTLKFPSHPRAK